MMANIVSDNKVVTLEYALHLDDGELVEESTDTEPLEYIHGIGQLIPGLEKSLSGMRVGDSREVVLEADEGYGEYQEGLDEEIPMDSFPEDFEPEIDMPLVMTDDQGKEFTFYVTGFGEEGVVVSPNHPLAGETLH